MLNATALVIGDRANDWRTLLKMSDKKAEFFCFLFFCLFFFKF